MSLAAERARSIWLLSFGDVVTLLITFFIMTIALNKGMITQVQKWAEDQLDLAYNELSVETEGFKYIEVKRNSLGIEILVEDSTGFEKGGFKPSFHLEAELSRLSQALGKLSLFDIGFDQMPKVVQHIVSRDQLEWRVDVNVAGHTDNDRIDPRSYLRNNWFLSTMRAQSVMQILQRDTGLNPNIFAVAGYGEFRPIKPNSSEENKAQNRRIDIVLTATFEKRPN